MDGKILAESLALLDQADLRAIYAQFFKIDLRRHLLPRLKGTETGDKLLELIREEAEELQAVEDGVLQVDLFLEMTELLQLPGQKYDRQEAIESQAGEIIAATFAQLEKSDPEFREFLVKAPVAGKIHQLILYQLQKLFAIAGPYPVGELKELSEELVLQLEGLAPEQQEQIRLKLGAESLSEKEITLMLSTTGVDPLFRAIAGTGGFAFIRTAQILFNKAPGSAGLLNFLPVLVGESKPLSAPQNKTLRKRLLPAVILQIVLPALVNKTERQVSFKPFINEWKQRFAAFMDVYGVVQEIKEDIEFYERELELNLVALRHTTDEIELAKELASYERQKVRIDLVNRRLDRLPYVSDRFSELAATYQSMEITAGQLHERGIEPARGFVGRISNALQNLSVTHELRELRKEADNILEQMAEEVLKSDSAYKAKERENLQRYTEKYEELYIQRDEFLVYREHLKDDLQQARFNLQDRMDEVKKKAKEIRGFQYFLPKE